MGEPVSTRDLKTYAELGRALWADPSRSGAMAVETLSAISLLDLTQERALERAAAVLLGRAVRQGMASNTVDALGLGSFNPFFRLQPQERFVLVALHLGRWSYERVARVMKANSGTPEGPEVIEALAWKARTRIAIEKGLAPIGASLASASCPDYDPERPWTQRFLDEEIGTGRHAIFLQNHLMACDSCRRALVCTRDIYFRVDGMLPRVAEDDGLLELLGRVISEGKKFRSSEGITFADSVYAFLGQRGIQVLLALILLGLFLHFRQA